MMNYDRDATGPNVYGVGNAHPGSDEDNKESKIKRVSADFINAVCLKVIYPPSGNPKIKSSPSFFMAVIASRLPARNKAGANQERESGIEYHFNPGHKTPRGMNRQETNARIFAKRKIGRRRGGLARMLIRFLANLIMNINIRRTNTVNPMNKKISTMFFSIHKLKKFLFIYKTEKSEERLHLRD